MSKKVFYHVEHEHKMFSDDQINWKYGILTAIEENTLWKFVDNTYTNYKYCRDETYNEREERTKRTYNFTLKKEMISVNKMTNNRNIDELIPINTNNKININDDVDMIYELAFSSIVENIQNGDWCGKYSNIDCLGTTYILKSPECRQAHKLNPVRFITTNDNCYCPYGDEYNKTPYISVGINNKILDALNEFGTLEKLADTLTLKQKKILMVDITPERIKGSIHHEITHWLDDTLHNNHIRKRISWAEEASRNNFYKKAINIINQDKRDVNLTNYEINAQISSIKQLQRGYKYIWNLLSFDDMINLNASLAFIRNELRVIGEYENWKKKIIKRLHREQLLVKSMTYTT